TLIDSYNFRDYLFPARRHFIEERKVEVAIDGEREGAGDRSGGHGKQVRRKAILPNQFSSLSCAESVLFVYDYKSQILEFYAFLNKRVSACQYGYDALCHP